MAPARLVRAPFLARLRQPSAATSSVLRAQLLLPQRELSTRPAAGQKLQRPALQSRFTQKRFSSTSTPSSTGTAEAAAAAAEGGESKKWTFDEIKKLSSSMTSSEEGEASDSEGGAPRTILIDVREPAELEATGRIPGAINVPVGSQPDGLFLPAHEFEARFGCDKPRAHDVLVFYCKAGVRSRAAAGMARLAGWSHVAEYPGSWLDWFERGGPVER